MYEEFCRVCFYVSGILSKAVTELIRVVYSQLPSTLGRDYPFANDLNDLTYGVKIVYSSARECNLP